MSGYQVFWLVLAVFGLIVTVCANHGAHKDEGPEYDED